MKKEIFLVFLVIVIGALFLAYSYITTDSKINQEVTIEVAATSGITKTGNYNLDCRTHYYTNTAIGGELTPESYIKIAKGNEQQVLYVEGDKAKMWGADFEVIYDNSSYLVIMRTYPVSGLTEVISLNKATGIGFDVKTLSFGLNGPNSDTYVLSCSQI